MSTALRLTCALVLVLVLVSGTALAADPAPPATPAEAPLLQSAPLLNGSAAWRSARWGMTAEEVLKAFVGEAIRLDPEEKLADGKVVAIGIERFDVGGVPCRVRFLFEGGKLVLVSLKSAADRFVEPATYEALERRLTSEAGRGEVTPKEASFDIRQTRFKAGGTALDLKYLQGTLVLLYHPNDR